MENTQQQNVTPVTLAAILATGLDISAATIEQITAALFGIPVFTSSVGDPFETKAPDGSGATWSGRRMASASVPLCILGHEIGLNFRCTVYRDVSPDGESYAVRASLPQGASKWQSAFEGDDQLVAALRFHVADYADRWLSEQAKTARPSKATNTTVQPRLVVRKLTKTPDASTPAPAQAQPHVGMTEAEYEALRARIVAEVTAAPTQASPIAAAVAAAVDEAEAAKPGVTAEAIKANARRK